MGPTMLFLARCYVVAKVQGTVYVMQSLPVGLIYYCTVPRANIHTVLEVGQ